MAQAGVHPITSEKDIKGMLAVSWVSYLFIYTGRYNFQACMGDMIQNNGFTRTGMGTVAAAFFVAFGLGVMASGFLGDRLSPVPLVFSAILSIGVCNTLFAFLQSQLAMVAVWSLNGVAQAFIWAPMVRLFVNRLSGPQCLKTCVLLCTTGPAGMLLSYGLCTWFLTKANWRAAFFLPGIVLLGTAFWWLFCLRGIERRADAGARPPGVRPAQPTAPVEVPWVLGQLIARSGMVVIGVVCFLLGVLKDGVTTWMPTYLMEQFGLSSSFSVALTMALPVVNLLGVWAANILTQRVFQNEMAANTLLFAVTLAAVTWVTLAAHSLPTALLALTFITTAMVGAGTVFTSIMPLHFRHTGRSATATGLLSFLAYFGSAAASYGFGHISQQFGWAGTRLAWCALALLGVLLCWAGQRKWKHFRKKEL